MNNPVSLLKSTGFWTIIGAMATVITAYPIIKEIIQAHKEVDITIGNYPVKDSQHLSLYYIVPNENTPKYQLPIPLKFINAKEVAIENFAASINVSMKKIIHNNKEGYMKRILTNQENINNHEQNIYISSKTFVSKGMLDISTEDYMFNVVNENNINENDIVWDTFDFDLNITYDNQKEAKKIHCTLFCCFSQDLLKTEQILKDRLTDQTMPFLIRTTKAYKTQQNNDIPITVCKLSDEANSITKIKVRKTSADSKKWEVEEPANLLPDIELQPPVVDAPKDADGLFLPTSASIN